MNFLLTPSRCEWCLDLADGRAFVGEVTKAASGMDKTLLEGHMPPGKVASYVGRMGATRKAARPFLDVARIAIYLSTSESSKLDHSEAASSCSAAHRSADQISIVSS